MPGSEISKLASEQDQVGQVRQLMSVPNSFLPKSYIRGDAIDWQQGGLE